MSRNVDLTRLHEVFRAVNNQEKAYTYKVYEDHYPSEPLFEFRDKLEKLLPETVKQWALQDNPNCGYGNELSVGAWLCASFATSKHPEWASMIVDKMASRTCYYRSIRITAPQVRNPRKKTTLATFFLSFEDERSWEVSRYSLFRIAREFKGLPLNPYLAITVATAPVDEMDSPRRVREKDPHLYLPCERSRRVRTESTGEGNIGLIKVVFTVPNGFSIGAIHLRQVLAKLLQAGITEVDIQTLKRLVSV